tara:strand:- start:509 stop:1276 length:768 start_codon:yes stop_codon:yes gene_type:complete
MFKKKLLIITGAGQGIGKHIAENVTKEYELLLISKSNNCKKVAEKINLKNKREKKAMYIKINFEKKINLKLLLSKLNYKKYSEIHLVLCAGVVDYNFKSYLKRSDWIKVFQVNLFSQIQLINFFINLVKKKKYNKKIIYFSGGGAANSFKEFPIYSASKTALVRTVENYAEIYKKKNINIFAVAPGTIRTKMSEKVRKIAKIKPTSKLSDVSKFINLCLKINTRIFSGRLINIKDNFKNIKKNKDSNFLKIRRVE